MMPEEKNASVIVFAGIGLIAVLACAALADVFFLHVPAAWFRSQPPPSLAPTYTEEVTQAEQSNAAALSSVAASAASSTAAADFPHLYQDPSFGFSFKYPDGFSVGAAQDSPGSGAAYTVLVQDTAQNLGFQIYVSPWSGAALTAGDIAADLPQIDMRNVEAVSMDGTPGITFEATDPNFGNSLQAWFVRAGALYQISTYATQGPLLSKVLGTWRWGQAQ